MSVLSPHRRAWPSRNVRLDVYRRDHDRCVRVFRARTRVPARRPRHRLISTLAINPPSFLSSTNPTCNVAQPEAHQPDSSLLIRCVSPLTCPPPPFPSPSPSPSESFHTHCGIFPLPASNVRQEAIATMPSTSSVTTEHSRFTDSRHVAERRPGWEPHSVCSKTVRV